MNSIFPFITLALAKASASQRPPSRCIPIMAALAAFFVGASLTRAQSPETLFWGGGSTNISNNTTVSTSNSTLAGNWTTTTSNWADWPFSPNTYSTWEDGSIAAFGYHGSSGASNPTVRLADNYTLGGMVVQQGYSLNSTASPVNLTVSGTISTLSTSGDSGALTLTNNVQLAGDSDLIKWGLGRITLGGNNTAYTGNVSILDGSFNIRNSLSGVTNITLKSSMVGKILSNPTLLSRTGGNPYNSDLVLTLSRGILQIRSDTSTAWTLGKIILEGAGIYANETGGVATMITLADTTQGLTQGANGRGTLHLGSAADGSLKQNFKVTNPGTIPVDTLLPWITNARAEFYELDSGSGNELVRVTSTSADSNLSNWATSYDSSSDLRVSGALSNSLSANLTINSLGVNASATLNLGGNTLNVASGGLSMAGGSGVSVQITNGNLTTNAGALYLGTGPTTAFTSLGGISATITGGMDVVKSGWGAVALTGSTSNSYTGTTYVNYGSLDLNKTGSAVAVPGDLVVRDGGSVLIVGSNPFGATSNVTIGSTLARVNADSNWELGGKLTLNNSFFELSNNSDTGIQLKGAGTGFEFHGGRVHFYSNSGLTTVNGNISILTDVSYGAQSTSQAVFESARADGPKIRLALNTGANAGTATRTFHIADSSTLAEGVSEMVVNGVIRDGGSGTTKGALRKTGAGVLQLVEANTYTGGTTIEEGTLRLSTISLSAQSGLSGWIGAGGSNTIIVTFLDPIAPSFMPGQIINFNGTQRTIWAVIDDYRLRFGDSGVTAGFYNGTISTSAYTRTGSTLGDVSLNGGKLLIDTAANTVGGNLIFGGGVLELGIGNTFDYGSKIVNSTGAIHLNTLTAQNINLGALAASNVGGLTKSGAGTLTLTGNNTYTGTTTISTGTLVIGTTGRLGGGNYSGNIANEGIFEFASNSDQTLAGILSGNGSLVKNGTANLILSGANSFSGGTTLNTGTITLQSANALGTGAFTQTDGTSLLTIDTTGNIANTLSIYNVSALQSGTLSGAITVNNATFDVESGDTLTISGGIGGSGGVVKIGAGTLALSGMNTYTGGTTINAGNLTLSGGSAVPDNGAVTLADVAGAVLHIASSETIGTLSGGGSTGGNISLAASQTLTVNQSTSDTFAGAISGAGGLTKSGTATLTLSGSSNYSGATSVTAGVLRAENSDALGATAGSTTVSSGAALELAGDIAIGAEALSLAGTGIGGNGSLRNISGNNSLAGAVTLAAASTIGSDADTLTLSGGISGTNTNLTLTGSGTTIVSTTGLSLGSGTLTKNGSGTLSLDASNSYTGATTINSGTLLINNTSTASAITIASSGVLGGNGSAGATTVQSGGRIGAGTLASSVATLDVASLTLQGGGGYNWDITNVSGTAGTNWDLITVGGGSADATITATSGNKFIISVGGNPTGWDPTASYSWDIIGWGTGTVFDPAAFAVDSTRFTGETPRGTWTLASAGGFLNLAYSFGGDPVWSGGTGNWSTGFSPAIEANQTPAVFFTGAGGTATNNIASSTFHSLASITFNSTAGAYTLAASSGAAGVNSSNPMELRGGILNNSTATQTLSMALLVNATRTIDTAAGNIVLSGPVTGSGGLEKSGASILTLSGTNTYSGGTTITAGNLTLSGGSALADNGAVTLANTAGAVLHIAAAETIGSLSGGGASGGNISLASGQTLTVNQTADTTFSGTISGAAALALKGTGTLALAAANTHTGGTSLTGATLRIDHADALGSSGNISFSGGTLQFGTSITPDLSARIKNSTGQVSIDTNSQSLTFASAIDSSNSGGLSKNGAGTLTLSSANTYTGTTTINAGTLTLSGGSAILDNGAVTLANTAGAVLHIAASETIGSLSGGGSTGGNVSIASGQTLTVNQTTATSFNSSITGAGDFTKAGAATLTLAGTHSLTGTTTINAGTLALAAANLLPSTANVTISAPGTLQLATGNQTFGSLAGSGTVALGTNTLSTGTYDSSFSGTLSGLGGLTKAGAGTFTFTGTGDFFGDASILGGTLVLDSATSLRNDAIVYLGAGATLVLEQNLIVGAFNNDGGTLSGNGSLVSSFTITESGTLSAVIADGTDPVPFAAGLRKITSGTTVLDAANTYTGLTRIDGGSLTLGANGSLSAASSLLTFAGATLDLANKSQSFSAINGSGGTIALGSGTLTINGSTTSTTAAAITGTGALVKEGSGTLVLSANNTYSGATTVNGGVLRATHQNALGSTAGGVTVAGGAALEIEGAITIGAEALALSGSGVAGAGALRSTSGDNTYQGAITLNAASRINTDSNLLTLTGGISGSHNLTIGGEGTTAISSAIATSGGTLTKDGEGTLILSAHNTYSGGTTLDSGTLTVAHTNALGSGAFTQTDGTSLLVLDTTGTVANALSIYNIQALKTLTLGGGITVNNATFDVAEDETLTISGAIGGSGGVVKNGEGTLALNAANTFTGDTVVNAGVLSANAAGALASTGNITVHNGGSLLVTASDAIGDSTNMNLAGGSLAFDGDITETLGSLTLSANSVIDMGGGNISLMFADLVEGLTNTTRLNIYNYTLHSDHISFSSNANLSDSLPYISFYSGFGTGFIGNSFIEGISPYEIRPVPEPETWATALLLLLAGAWWLKRKPKHATRPM